jgi:hypothetical protein
MMGNCHVRFLGEGAEATQTPLPDSNTLNWVMAPSVALTRLRWRISGLRFETLLTFPLRDASRHSCGLRTEVP